VGVQFSGAKWVFLDQDWHTTGIIGAFKVNVGVAGEPDIWAFFYPAWRQRQFDDFNGGLVLFGVQRSH